ncbi:30S ribosomal protein S1 [Desulfobacterales bacterium HSG16]|nr:30S ribosomal protein S1 [Desulfobacterales bacterium HSG16]
MSEKTVDPDRFAEVISESLADEKILGREQSFAEMLDSYQTQMDDDVQVGDKVSGEIISIGMDTVFLNTGTKIDGAVDSVELFDEEGNMPYKVGDTIELYIVSLSEHEMKLSKAMSGIGGLNMLQDAYAGKIPVEGKVKEVIKGGFHVEMMQKRAFCPVSQMDIRYVEKPEEYVGGVHRFLVTKFEEKGKNIVVSRRVLLEEEQAKEHKVFFEQLEIGAVIEGKVSKVMPFGAFVEIFPGVEGMVHVSELSWSRVENPEEVVKSGDMVTVQVLKVEPGEKKNRHKISLSIKQIGGDPWEDEEQTFKVGDKVRGKVTKCMGFGAFVEIAPGVEGLVHISEMSYKKRVSKPEEIVTQGETIDVMVKDIDIAKRRISLSIRDAEGDPWIGVNEKYIVGQSVEGHIEKKEKFGFFINLEPGITGLLPMSLLKKSPSANTIEKLKEGSALTVIVQEINADARKLSLRAADTDDEGDWKSYAGNQQGKSKTRNQKETSSGSAGMGSMGIFGEKLQQAMDRKNKK